MIFDVNKYFNLGLQYYKYRFAINVFRITMCSIYNSRNELGVIWIWYLTCYHVALIKIVFHIFKANAYLVFSLYNNELNTLHYMHLLRLHSSVFDSKFVSNEQFVDMNPHESYFIDFICWIVFLFCLTTEI